MTGSIRIQGDMTNYSTTFFNAMNVFHSTTEFVYQIRRKNFFSRSSFTLGKLGDSAIIHWPHIKLFNILFYGIKISPSSVYTNTYPLHILKSIYDLNRQQHNVHINGITYCDFGSDLIANLTPFCKSRLAMLLLRSWQYWKLKKKNELSFLHPLPYKIICLKGGNFTF